MLESVIFISRPQTYVWDFQLRADGPAVLLLWNPNIQVSCETNGSGVWMCVSSVSHWLPQSRVLPGPPLASYPGFLLSYVLWSVDCDLYMSHSDVQIVWFLLLDVVVVNWCSSSRLSDLFISCDVSQLKWLNTFCSRQTTTDTGRWRTRL